MRFIITLSYDGAAFCGWQVQPGDPSVQECLEKALSTLLRQPVSVTGAGRTDSGVNAIGYVAHFDIVDVGSCDPALLAYKLNAILPPSVVVHSIVRADGDFHARFDASQRKYTYFLHRLKDPFVERYSLRRDWDLDFGAMNRAAALLLGRHDFACFQKTGTDVKTSVCTVTEAFWAPYEPAHVSLMGFAPAAPDPAGAAGVAGAAEAAEVAEAAEAAGAAGTAGRLREAGTCPGGECFPQTPGSSGFAPVETQGLPGTGTNVFVPAGLDAKGWRYAYFRISADRFLRNMVRAVVGTLLEVGRGKRSLESFAALILPVAPAPAADGTEKANSVRSEAASAVDSTKRAESVRSEAVSTVDSTEMADSVRSEAISAVDSTKRAVSVRSEAVSVLGGRGGGAMRSQAGDSVPGHALFLSKVEYPTETAALPAEDAHHLKH